MRTDPTKNPAFQKNEAWNGEGMEMHIVQRAKPEDGEGPPFRAVPFSGGERNRLFINQGENFKDVTLVSGVDFRQDGRGFVLFDYDRDGFQDLAIVSPNEPRFRIVRNRMGESEEAENHSFVEVRLVGGHTKPEPSFEWSPRDPFGATVTAVTGDSKRMFQLSCGEGLASQNSKRIHIGLADTKAIDQLIVHWPSGKKTVVENVDAGQRITIHENDEEVQASAKSKSD